MTHNEYKSLYPDVSRFVCGNVNGRCSIVNGNVAGPMSNMFYSNKHALVAVDNRESSVKLFLAILKALNISLHFA